MINKQNPVGEESAKDFSESYVPFEEFEEAPANQIVQPDAIIEEAVGASPGIVFSPFRQFLARIGGASVYVSTGDGRPLDLPFDALVIPADAQAALTGSFALHAEEVLADDWTFFKVGVHSSLSSLGGSLKPDHPVFVPILSRPFTLIAATGWVKASERATLDGAAQAVRAVIAGCRVRRLSRVAIPLLGARGGGLPPVQVVRAMLAEARSALPAASGIRELTIIAQEEEAYEKAISLFTRIPQRFANDLPGGEDLLDVAGEVQALTDILLLRDLQPPLAVGILGGWGTGKSFVMDLMRRHIQHVRGLPPGGWEAKGAGLYVGHVYPVTFDAWTYAKSNLWASLMQTIFFELSRQVHLEQRIRDRFQPDPDLEGRLWRLLHAASDRDREALLDLEGLEGYLEELSSPEAQLDAEGGRVLWEVVAKLKVGQQSVLAQKQEELASITASIEEQKASLEEEVDKALRDKTYELAWSNVSAGLKRIVTEALSATQGGEAVARDGRAARDFLSQVGSDAAAVPMSLKAFWIRVKANPVVSASTVLVFLVLLGAGLLLDEQLPRAVAFLGSVLTPLAAAVQTAKSWRAQVAAAWSGLEREVRAAESSVENERAAILQRKLEESPAAGQLRELEEGRRRLESEIGRLRQQIGFTADYVSVADLVQARLGKAEYEGELGLLHRVQRDLDELSQALCLPPEHPLHSRLPEQFPRGPARIVLFVDDLDRCPPERVVEVLEAVQLLVKTPLFVVVLAMDVRYVTRALEKVYKDILLRHGNPCGLDYIEKIVQIPYSVRPIDSSSVERFLRGQMEVQAAQEAAPEPPASGSSDSQAGPSSASGRVEEPAPITPEVVAFTVDELEWVKRCCQRLPLSPRAVKRVVNALKLLKIVWFRPNRHQQPEPGVQEAFVVLLALSAAYPNGMRSLFEELSRRAKEEWGVGIAATLGQLAPRLGDLCSAEEAAGLEKNLELIPAAATVDPDLWATLELVRSLSFVAEIGYDPADERAWAADPNRG
ncbi:MAG TPA: P-loop NTPase fold protein [Thermoanaerobaculia bacterium]|nr:P-loop NTPase fold protein [Thermoanaerobaculia bacterium]